GRGADAARLKPRDGRGSPLRRAAADARRGDPRAGHSGRTALAYRRGRPRPGVPRAHPRSGGRRVITTAGRVLRQLRHDPRTGGLMILVPTALMVLLRYVLDVKLVFSHVAPDLLGIFPFLLMFLVTSIAT